MDNKAKKTMTRYAVCQGGCKTTSKYAVGETPYCLQCNDSNFMSKKKPGKFASAGIFFSLEEEFRRFYKIPEVFIVLKNLCTKLYFSDSKTFSVQNGKHNTDK